MKVIATAIFLFFSIMSMADAKTPVHLIRSKPAIRPPASTGVALDTYLFGNMILFPYFNVATTDTCRQIWLNFVAASGVRDLFPHDNIDFEAAMMDDCIVLPDGSVQVWVTARIAARDEEGNELLRKFVAEALNRDFYGNKVAYKKPQKTVFRYEVVGWEGNTSVGHDGPKDARVYNPGEDMIGLDQEFAEFRTALSSTSNYDTFVNYLNSDFSNGPHDDFLSDVIPKSDSLSLEARPTYLFEYVTHDWMIISYSEEYQCAGIGLCLQ